MRYISTRGGILEPITFSESIVEGLAPDQGLIIPESYPQYSIDDLESMRDMGFPELSFNLLGDLADDIPSNDLETIIKKVYTKERFGTKDITPLTELFPETYLLDLANGPTLAFKDIALQLLTTLLEYTLEKNESYLNVLLASSGDTISSAIEASIGKSRLAVIGLTPFEKMSLLQAAQAYSVIEPNIHNLAVRTVFDGCQDIVKAVNKDEEFKEEYHIGALNSINWGRVAAQIVYYFKAYFAATSKPGEEVDFAVPTGNFGDILAGYIAKKMGLPIRNLILATNENDVLDIFYKTGLYKVREKEDVIKTSSFSMDIAKASNFERWLYDLVGQNPETVRAYMTLVNNAGGFNLAGTDFYDEIGKSGIVSGRSLHQDRMNTIKYVYDETKLVIDTHTADGFKVGQEYKEKGVKLICISTAKPTKFEEYIAE
ncbi:MAG: threonine synthase, partial [Candidatus Woesearchaeota archaeon]